MIEYVWLVPLFPLAGFLINGLLRNSLSKSLTGIIGSGSILASFIVSILIFLDVKAGIDGPVIVTLFDFISFQDVSIPFAFQVDQLSSLFLLIITGIGFLIHVYSVAYMHEENSSHFARYFAYLNLFVFSMLLLVLGSNYVIMFIGWEGVGLCSYLLIGYWFKNIEYSNAARKAFVMNRIGDLGFLLAVFWLIGRIGTVNFSEVFSKVDTLSSLDLTAITMLLFIGATGKSAQIPLYTWLPDAMAGPTPVSALIHAATMVTAGIYMIARSNILYTMAPTTQTVVMVVGLGTALLAATIALKQNDIKKVLAYSTVSQLGYMFIALGVGAYTGAVFHVMTHAFFKALLFLGAGSVIHAMHHEQDIRNMGGLSKKLKTTHLTFLVGCLAIAGIIPFSGFFSKDEILAAAFMKSPIVWALAAIGALMTAFYMFRLYAMTFLGKFRGTSEQEHHLHESPPAMTIPLVILAVLSFAGGLVGIPEVLMPDSHSLAKFLEPVFAESNRISVPHHPDHTTELLLMFGLMAVIAVVIFWAVGKYKKYEKSGEENTGFARILENKWYVDEIYEALIIRPVNAFGKMLGKFDNFGIDWVVNGVGRSVQYASRQIRLLQSGQVGSYVLLMVIGMIVLFALQVFLKK
ncbi:NADH:ubiquinone oxidoreductase subunit L [Flavihumibacter sp. ZG627]|nr:NADH:ubiquinone oxidoreductase subunit L [Flavihumibacter sp. ZG627]